MKTTTTFSRHFTFKSVLTLTLFYLLPHLLPAQLSVSINSSPVSCFGAANGQAEAIPSGGIPPYTFLWNNGATTPVIQNLAPGFYSVNVTDSNQNMAGAGKMILQPPALGLAITGQSQLCTVAPDGWTLAVPYGGTSPYNFLWSNGISSAENNNLVGGTYTVTVSDANGCTMEGSYVVGFWAAGLWMNFTKAEATCGLANGSVAILNITGTAPYQFQWSTGDTTAYLENVAAGTYTLMVSDVNGCATPVPLTVEIETDIPAPKDIYPSSPLCLKQTGVFVQEIDPEYTDKFWSINNSLDQIIQGQGTDSLSVHWNSSGDKIVQLQYGANNTYCSTVTYHLYVAVCAGIQEKALEEVKLSPNPFSDFLQFELPETLSAGAEVLVYDINAKLMLQQSLHTGNNLLSTNDFPSGFYSLKLISGESIRSWKIARL